MNSIWSLNEAVNLAMLREKQVQRSVSHSGFSWRAIPFDQTKIGQCSSTRSPVQKPTETPPVVEKGAPPKQLNPYAKPTTKKFFRWNLPGHHSNECPTQPQSHLVEQNDDSKDHQEDVWEDDQQ